MNLTFVNIYLENKTGGWIFFKIKRGQMGIASSIPEVYNTITLLKPSDKTYREGKEVTFEFMPADLGMRDNFVVRMEDFKERFKSKGFNKSATTSPPVNAPTIKAEENQVPAEKPSAPAPVVPKDDFKQKPQKPFSLDAPKPKEIAPATDTTTIKPK
jgi:hypothetical protein